MRFEFATATRILFGAGTVREIPALAAGFGRRALLVTGKNAERAAPLLEELQEASVDASVFQVPEEPTIDLALSGVQKARRAGAQVIIGLGGGSALDAGKAIAALLTNPGDPLDYLEVVGRGQPLTQDSAPYIAVPTTAGTGAEVTRNAVLAVPAQRVKVSMRSPRMLPTLAVVDPELTLSLPPAITASTGLDALTQLLEPFVSHQANPLTDSLCREGLRRAGRSLRRAFEHGGDARAREDMSLASLLGGLALANAKLGAVHGFAGPLGGMFTAPHGAVCARLLPFVMRANLQALESRASHDPALSRYAEAAQLLTGHPEAQASDGMGWIQTLCADLDVPPLSAYGLRKTDLPEVVAKARQSSSMKGNPITLTDEELLGVLSEAL